MGSGRLQLPARAHPGRRHHQKLKEAGRLLLSPADTLTSDFWPPELSRKFLWFVATQVVVLAAAALAARCTCRGSAWRAPHSMEGLALKSPHWCLIPNMLR